MSVIEGARVGICASLLPPPLLPSPPDSRLTLLPLTHWATSTALYEIEKREQAAAAKAAASLADDATRAASAVGGVGATLGEAGGTSLTGARAAQKRAEAATRERFRVSVERLCIERVAAAETSAATIDAAARHVVSLGALHEWTDGERDGGCPAAQPRASGAVEAGAPPTLMETTPASQLALSLATLCANTSLGSGLYACQTAVDRVSGGAHGGESSAGE